MVGDEKELSRSRFCYSGHEIASQPNMESINSGTDRISAGARSDLGQKWKRQNSATVYKSIILQSTSIRLLSFNTLITTVLLT